MDPTQEAARGVPLSPFLSFASSTHSCAAPCPQEFVRQPSYLRVITRMCAYGYSARLTASRSAAICANIDHQFDTSGRENGPGPIFAESPGPSTSHAGVSQLTKGCHSPPWQRRGGCARQENAAKPPCREQTGWFIQDIDYRFGN